MIEIEDNLQNEVPTINFKNVSFSWPGNKDNVINKCSFSINKRLINTFMISVNKFNFVDLFSWKLQVILLL